MIRVYIKLLYADSNTGERWGSLQLGVCKKNISFCVQLNEMLNIGILDIGQKSDIVHSQHTTYYAMSIKYCHDVQCCVI